MQKEKVIGDKMKNILTKLGKDIVTGATSLSLLATPVAGQALDGWLEASAGQNPTGNLRLYPSLKLSEDLTLQSLIDNNNYYPFSKTDLKDDIIKAGPVKISLVATLHTNPSGKRITAGPNISYHGKKGFGFAELDLDPFNLNTSEFYTYNSGFIGDGGARIGLFTTSSVNDFKSTYAELEATGNDFGNTGVAPYARANFIGGKYDGFQAGISSRPKQTLKWLKGKGQRSK